MSELLPCPFCGGEAYVHEHYSCPGYDRNGKYPNYEPIGYAVGCMTLDCRGKRENTGFMYNTEAEAIEAWNTRADERGECEYVIEDNMNESEGTGDVWFRCTNCDTRYDYQADDWLLKMPHCPKCGATVKAVR